MLPQIERGSRIIIRAQGREIRGLVKVIANRPLADGRTDAWNYWDLEYDIENPLPGHGSYGRWKQSADGGSVELLPDERKLAIEPTKHAGGGESFIIHRKRKPRPPVGLGSKFTARNCQFLAEIKRTWNRKIYAKVLALYNAEGETAAANYLQKFTLAPVAGATEAPPKRSETASPWNAAGRKLAEEREPLAGHPLGDALARQREREERAGARWDATEAKLKSKAEVADALEVAHSMLSAIEKGGSFSYAVWDERMGKIEAALGKGTARSQMPFTNSGRVRAEEIMAEAHERGVAAALDDNDARRHAGEPSLKARAERPWGIMAHRLPSSRFGAASEPVKKDGEIVRFATLAEAEAEARRLNSGLTSPNVAYAACALD